MIAAVKAPGRVVKFLHLELAPGVRYLLLQSTPPFLLWAEEMELTPVLQCLLYQHLPIFNSYHFMLHVDIVKRINGSQPDFGILSTRNWLFGAIQSGWIKLKWNLKTLAPGYRLPTG
jgi:hypothetical protein